MESKLKGRIAYSVKFCEGEPAIIGYYSSLIDAQEANPRALSIKEAVVTSSCLTAVKHDDGKTRWDLLPFEALDEVAKVMTFGSKKYADNNWRGGFKYSRVIGAAFRHLTYWVRGDTRDPETGLSHLAHCACCILFLLTFEQTKTGQDDRFVYPTDKVG